MESAFSLSALKLFAHLRYFNNEINTTLLCATGTRGRWEAKKSNREKKERFENKFSYFKRRKGNLKSIFPVSRREIEIRQNIINLSYHQEKGIYFAQALRRETEILNIFLQLSAGNDPSYMLLPLIMLSNIL